jgi:hypothetical protein
VDYSNVEHAAKQIVKSDRDTHLVLGNPGLSSLLNVDFSHVEHAAQQIVKSDRDTHLVLGNTGAFLC